MPPVSVKYNEHGRPQVKRSEIQARASSGYPVSGVSVTPGSGENFPLNIQGLGDNSTCVPSILPDSFVIQRNVPIHGITQLGLRSHPTGSTTQESLTMTLSFVRSDKPVYTTVSIRPFSPCHRTQAMAGSTVSHMSGIPIRPLQSEFTIFTDASTQGCGSHIGDSQILVVWTCSERKLHMIVLELMAVILAFQH